MSSPTVYTGTRPFRLRSLQMQLRTNLNSSTRTNSRALHNLARNGTQRLQPCRSTTLLNGHTSTSASGLLNPRMNALTSSLLRAYSPSASPTEASADNLIEELQDLYEIAKDEFEIATDSTDGSTIYAASDRESARDALNQLVTVYELYIGVRGVGGAGEEVGEREGEGVVETKFEPAAVSDEVRGEIKRRVGQRVRELKNAVEILEERAHDEN